MALMDCTIRVDASAPGWANNVRSLLYSIHGVRTVNIDGYGFVEVSGFDVHPEVLIWKLAQAGYRALLCSTRFGGYCGRMNGYDHQGGYRYNRPFARLAYELRQKLAAPPPPPPPPYLAPRPRRVYAPRYIHDRPGCCSLM